jgi:hypothetical protein
VHIWQWLMWLWLGDSGWVAVGEGGMGDCGSFGGNLSGIGAVLSEILGLAQVAVAGWQWLGGSGWVAVAGWRGMEDCGTFGV